ncbi:terminal ear1 homolog [Olea europaea subsp. europaea]|uniref:Terminal ear1 homolog n=1 Tax=Olea europaea subsp. europaea TaxID=158383 RepID=A0A8S0S4G6_OLEEU|nr:terminal ear1 homolog [Olea europaea subsp. europaea]
MTSKSLNPKAEEWKPPLSQLSAPLQPLQLVTCTAAQLPKQSSYHAIVPSPPQPFYQPPFISFMPNHYWYFIYSPTTISVDQTHDVYYEENLKSHCITGGKVLESSWRSPKYSLKCLPPRFLIARRACNMENKKKKKKKKNFGRQEWRRRKNHKNFENGVVVSSTEENFSLSGKTTVMIKNIPNQLRRDDVLKFLDKHCQMYASTYDFFYLPMDFRSKDNLGYAFANFTNAVGAIKITEILRNYQWGNIQTCKGTFVSKKICEVTWARIQGKKDLVARFEHSNFRCDQLDFLPVVFDPPRNGSEPSSVEIVVGRLQPRSLCKMKSYEELFNEII